MLFRSPGGGAWSTVSDRGAKENFETVNPEMVLERVAQLPITTWNYKSQDAMVRHIGPTAQDFSSAFGFGESDTRISTVDADGVALSAIQGLNRKLNEQRAELRKKEEKLQAQSARIESLERRLQALEKLLPAN